MTATDKPTTTTRKPRIRVLAPTRYLVESKSQPGLGRQCDVALRKCSCPAGQHGRPCYHLKWADQYHAWRQEQLAQAAPPAQAAPAVRAKETGMAALWAAFA